MNLFKNCIFYRGKVKLSIFTKSDKFLLPIFKLNILDKPTVIVSHYSSTPSQTLHIKYQRINISKAYTADEPAQDEQKTYDHNNEKKSIVIDFHYIDEEFAKYEVD